MIIGDGRVNGLASLDMVVFCFGEPGRRKTGGDGLEAGIVSSVIRWRFK